MPPPPVRITYINRSDEARRAIAAEIRASETEPERLRADKAEEDLAELREATHGWLSAGHALKLRAAEEARESGYAVGYAEGRAELLAERAASSEQLLRSRREVAAARAETVELVAAAGAAGAAALSKSRDVWRAEGRAEGLVAAAEQAAGADDGGVREAFSAYVVSAHEQKLSAVAKEREAAGEIARALSRELASANEMLATLLKVRRDPVAFSTPAPHACVRACVRLCVRVCFVFRGEKAAIDRSIKGRDETLAAALKARSPVVGWSEADLWVQVRRCPRARTEAARGEPACLPTTESQQQLQIL